MTLYTRTDTIKRSWRVSFSCVFAYFHNELRQPSVETCRHVANIRFQVLNLRSFHSRPAFFLTGFLICPSRLPVPKNFHRPFILANGSALGQHFPIFHFFPPRFLAHDTSDSKPRDIWCVMNWSYSLKTRQ